MVISRLVRRLQEGDVLAETLFDADGSVLLRRGVALSPGLIRAIARRGFVSVSIADGLADDILPANVVAAQVRAQASSTISRLSLGLNAAAVAMCADDDGTIPTIDVALERIGERQLPLNDKAQAALALVRENVVELIDRVLCAGSVESLESLKTHSEYTFEHSVDVAITGTLLGHRLGLTELEMSNLAFGCLMHDIGKTFIDLAVLNKPGPLTAEERRQIERHPEMGFELLRRLPLSSVLPAHVAYQHHERQDGGGYPRGLVGDNRALRSSSDRLDPRRMTLIGEIAAVADVHAALTSDRSYRAAISPELADEIVADMAGSHLNAEIVDLLRRIAPLHPTGSWVEVVDGPGDLLGWRGVVTAVTHARHPDIRLVLDADGIEREAREVKLLEHDDIKVRSLRGGVHPTEQDAVPISA